LPELQNLSNSEINKIPKWCNANKLTKNPNKCNVIVTLSKMNTEKTEFNTYVMTFQSPLVTVRSI